METVREMNIMVDMVIMVVVIVAMGSVAAVGEIEASIVPTLMTTVETRDTSLAFQILTNTSPVSWLQTDNTRICFTQETFAD